MPKPGVLQSSMRRYAEAAERKRVEESAVDMLALLREAYHLMSLGTGIRADWVLRACEVIAKAEGR